MPITDDDLAAWEAASAAATAGPWEARKTNAYDTRGREVMIGWIPEIGLVIESLPDTAFIAAARTALPALLAEVRRLRAGPPA